MNGVVHELVALNVDIGEAEKAHDVNTLTRILSEDLVFRRGSGVIVDRGTYLTELPDTTYQVLQSGEFEVDEKPESALVTLVVTVVGTRQGKPFAGRFRNTRLFVRDEGDWTCRIWINTRIGDLPS
jgi:hypothetical protein